MPPILDAKGVRTTLEKKDIESPTPRTALMPDGILDVWSAMELRDFFVFPRSQTIEPLFGEVITALDKFLKRRRITKSRKNEIAMKPFGWLLRDFVLS